MCLEEEGLLKVVLLRGMTYLGGECTWGGLGSRREVCKINVK